MATNDYTAQVITFAYIQGKWYSFPNPAAARAAVEKYSGNMQSLRSEKPTGVNIDTSLGWNLEGGVLPETILPAAGVTGDALFTPPLNPIIRSGETETVPPGTSTPIGGGGDEAEIIGERTIIDYDNSWDNLDQDLLNLAKRYADAGMMGRARQAFNQSGGTWDTDTHKRMIQERDQEGPHYGGQFEFDWANRGITDAADLEKIKSWAKGGLFGRIKQFMEAKKPGSYDKDVHVKLQAFTHRGKHDFVAPSTVTKDTAGAYLDTRTGKWRMPAPDGTTPGKAISTSTSTVDPSVYNPSAFKGAVKDIRGKFKTGQAREHAKTWRQTHMSAAEKKHGIKRDAAGKVVKPKSDTAWKAYIKQRNAVAGRHRQLIGAGKITLKSGAVIG